MKSKTKCFWCNNFFVDLIKHTKKVHKNLTPRSYGEKKFYCQKCKQQVFFGDKFCKECGSQQLWGLFG